MKFLNVLFDPGAVSGGAGAGSISSRQSRDRPLQKLPNQPTNQPTNQPPKGPKVRAVLASFPQKTRIIFILCRSCCSTCWQQRISLHTLDRTYRKSEGN